MPRKGKKKITFPKKYIDRIYKQVFYKECQVSLTRKDIENIKLSLNNTTKQDGNTSKDKTSKDYKIFKHDNNISIDEEPVKKKQKLNTNGIHISKLEFREGETHQSKSKVKSLLKLNKEIASASSKEVPPTAVDCAESTTSANYSAKNVEPTIRAIDSKKMLNGEERCIQFLNEFEFPHLTESFLSNKNSKPLTNGMKKFDVIKLSTSGPEASLSSTKVNGVKQLLNGKNHSKENLNEIEKLYKKYFSKNMQISIETIANILNVISISNEHLKARLDESTKQRSEAKKIKERCEARRLHEKYNTILEIKLKKTCIDVTSYFEELEFDSAFIMFFLSILSVIRVLDQPKFGNYQVCKLCKIVQQLLPESLINNESNHPKLFSMFQSKTFHSDCSDVIKIIIDSWDTDHGVADRMPLYFSKTSNSLKYFKPVINAVTGDSNEDLNLSLLIENAIFQCYYNTVNTDPELTVQLLNHSIPVTETIQSHKNSDKTIQHQILDKNQDGTNPDIPVLNGNQSQVIGNAVVEPSIVTNQPLSSFYESHSSSLQRKASKVISTKKYIVVVPTTISNSSLVQITSSSSETVTSTPTTTTTTTPTTCETFIPSTLNKLSVENSYLHGAGGRTILIDRNHYQLVKEPFGQLRALIIPSKSNVPLIQITTSSSETEMSTPTTTTCQLVSGPSGQMTALDNGTWILFKPPPIVTIRCDMVHCKNSATITCKCRKGNYCSESCREKHWTVHYADCEF